MRIHIGNIVPEGILIAEDLDPKELKDLQALQANESCTFQGMLTVRLRITPTAGMFQVAGHLDAKALLPCSRCLAPVQWPLRTSFRLTFARRPPGAAGEAPTESRELEAEELGMVLFEGDEIDFRDAIQEQVIMALPMQPVCRADCQGLCPHCGANLNDEACRCPGDDIDPRLAVLKKLKLDG